MAIKISLAEIANKIGATLNGDGDTIIQSLISMNQAQEGKGHITFLSDSSYKSRLAECYADAVILKPDDADAFSGNKLIMDDPYVGFALVAQLFDTTPAPAQGIAPSAVIDPSAHLGENVSIGANAVIESGVILGNDVIIGAGSFIGKNTQIGARSKMWANVSIYHDIVIGTDCLFQANSVIGADGFGYANDKGTWVKIPQLGRVIIGDHVEIGASTTIDRGAIEDTIIASNVIIDNQCQIGHNNQIGEGTALAGASAIAGSTKIGRHCLIGGAACVNGHIEVTDNVVITGMGMVVHSIKEPGMYSSGMPLQRNRQWLKTAARLLKINELHTRLKSVEKTINKDK